MIRTPHGLIFRLPSGAAFLVLAKPGPCKRCKAAHYFFVNRNGETLCSACDGGEEPEGLPAGLSVIGAAPSRVVGADAAFIRGFAHTRARCSECGEHPDPSDPALSNGVCCFCGYWGIPLGLEREEFRKRRRPKR